MWTSLQCATEHASRSIPAHSAACWRYRPNFLTAQFRGPPVFHRSELQNFMWGLQRPFDSAHLLSHWGVLAELLPWCEEEFRCIMQLQCFISVLSSIGCEFSKLLSIVVLMGAIVVTQKFVQTRPEHSWGYGKDRVDQQTYSPPGKMHTLVRQLKNGGEWEESIH